MLDICFCLHPFPCLLEPSPFCIGEWFFPNSNPSRCSFLTFLSPWLVPEWSLRHTVNQRSPLGFLKLKIEQRAFYLHPWSTSCHGHFPPLKTTRKTNKNSSSNCFQASDNRPHRVMMTLKGEMNDVGPTVAPGCCLKNSFQVSLQEGEHRQRPATSQRSGDRNQSSEKLKQLEFVERSTREEGIKRAPDMCRGSPTVFSWVLFRAAWVIF